MTNRRPLIDPELFDQARHEDEKAWKKYFWYLTHNWEREKSLDDFSYNVVRLFVTLNAGAILGVLAIVINDTNAQSFDKEIVRTSFVFWSSGLTTAFFCYFSWYFQQAVSLEEPRKIYDIITYSEPNEKSGDEKSEKNLKQKIKSLVEIVWALLTIFCGTMTGLFFLAGVWNIAWKIL